jgi:hypothetical protein
MNILVTKLIGWFFAFTVVTGIFFGSKWYFVDSPIEALKSDLATTQRDLNKTKDKLIYCEQGAKADDFEAYFEDKEIKDERKDTKTISQEFNDSDDSYIVHF